MDMTRVYSNMSELYDDIGEGEGVITFEEILDLVNSDRKLKNKTPLEYDVAIGKVKIDIESDKLFSYYDAFVILSDLYEDDNESSDTFFKIASVFNRGYAVPVCLSGHGRNKLSLDYFYREKIRMLTLHSQFERCVTWLKCYKEPSGKIYFGISDGGYKHSVENDWKLIKRHSNCYVDRTMFSIAAIYLGYDFASDRDYYLYFNMKDKKTKKLG